jgi:hypothetical protein
MGGVSKAKEEKTLRPKRRKPCLKSKGKKAIPSQQNKRSLALEHITGSPAFR